MILFVSRLSGRWERGLGSLRRRIFFFFFFFVTVVIFFSFFLLLFSHFPLSPLFLLKAYELSTLTGTQVLLLVASETGHVYTFATPKLQPLITKPEGKNLIQQCLNSAEGPSDDSPVRTFRPPFCTCLSVILTLSFSVSPFHLMISQRDLLRNQSTTLSLKRLRTRALSFMYSFFLPLLLFPLSDLTFLSHTQKTKTNSLVVLSRLHSPCRVSPTATPPPGIPTLVSSTLRTMVAIPQRRPKLSLSTLLLLFCFLSCSVFFCLSLLSNFPNTFMVCQETKDESCSLLYSPIAVIDSPFFFLCLAVNVSLLLRKSSNDEHRRRFSHQIATLRVWCQWQAR